MTDEKIINPQKVYNVKEAAKVLDIGEETLLDYLRDGKINAQKIGEWKILGQSLSDFLMKPPINRLQAMQDYLDSEKTNISKLTPHDMIVEEFKSLAKSNTAKNTLSDDEKRGVVFREKQKKEMDRLERKNKKKGIKVEDEVDTPKSLEVKRKLSGEYKWSRGNRKSDAAIKEFTKPLRKKK